MDNFCQLYYEDTHSQGQQYDKVLVLVHGNLISCKYWNVLINQIQTLSKNIRCISMDLRGYGRSQEYPQLNNMNDLANDLDQLLKTILKEKNDGYFAENVILTGWSLGGDVIMQLAVNQPLRYQKLILIASASVCGYALYREDEQGQIKCQTKQEVASHQKIALQQKKLSDKDITFYRMVFDKVLFNSGKLPPEEQYQELINEIFLQTNYTDICWVLNQFDISSGGTDQAKLIKGPVLIYHGEIDIVIPKIYAEGNYKEIGEEKCSLIIRPGIGHMPPLEDYENLANEIIKFLQQ